MQSSNRQRAFGRKAAFTDYVKTSAIAVATAAPLSAMANFSGDYTVNPPANGVYTDSAANGSFGNWTGTWTGSDNINFIQATLDTTAAPAGISIRVEAPSQQDYTFLVTAAASGLVSFDYVSAVLDPGDPSGPGVNNIEFVNQTTNSASSLNISGMFSTAVSVGDIFGFHLTNNYQGSVILTVTNFSAPGSPSQSVPEQGYTLGLLAFGFVGLLAFRATAARRSVSA